MSTETNFLIKILYPHQFRGSPGDKVCATVNLAASELRSRKLADAGAVASNLQIGAAASLFWLRRQDSNLRLSG
jgi:hypothetical protein